MSPKGNFNEPNSGNEGSADMELEKKSYANNGYISDEQDKNHNLKKQIEDRITSVEKEPMDFDDFLPHIGEFGIYQKMLFLLMIPFAFFVAWVYFTQIFITINPEQYWCRVPELENLTAEERYILNSWHVLLAEN